MKATWTDIEKTLNEGTLEKQSRETLEAFLRVEVSPSKNQTYFERYRDAKERIRHRLRELREQEGIEHSKSVRNHGAVWFVDVSRLLREIRRKTLDAQDARGTSTLGKFKGYLETDHQNLMAMWPKDAGRKAVDDLGRHIHYFTEIDLGDILKFDLPELEKAAEAHLLATTAAPSAFGFEALLHPAIRESSYSQFQSGHLRNAVLDSVICLSEQIRKASGMSGDGVKLVTDTFGGRSPQLIFSDLTSESGRNEQAGFMKILMGTFEGIRNPKAHSLAHDLTQEKAAQYLIFASLLARRIEEAKPNPSRPNPT